MNLTPMNLTRENIANIHRTRMSLYRQVLILGVLSFCTFIFSVVSVGVANSWNSFVNSIASIWMVTVSILSMAATTFFLYAQREAKNSQYIPAKPFLGMGYLFCGIWFTTAITMPTVGTVYCGYYKNLISKIDAQQITQQPLAQQIAQQEDFSLPSISSLNLYCATAGISDAFAWLCFLGFVFFTVILWNVGQLNDWGRKNNRPTSEAQTQQMEAHAPGLAEV